MEIKHFEVTTENWYNQAKKFESSYRAKANRRFRKLFTPEELGDLRIKADAKFLHFESLNKYNIWTTPFYFFADSDLEGNVKSFTFKSQSELYPEIPEFVLAKSEQILNTFQELYPKYFADYKKVNYFEFE